MDGKNEQLIANRIKQIRLDAGLTMEQFIERIDGKSGKGRSGTVNNWETGKNMPNKKRLKAIADLGNVPVPYLQGISQDKTGWEIWEANTGFSRDTIQAKIDERIASGKSKDSDTTYNKINMAVNDLMGYGDRNVNAINAISFQIRHLDSDKFFIDPEKDTDTLGNSHIKLRKGGKNYLYDDANPDVYNDIKEILRKASDDILKLRTKYNL